MQSTPRTAPHRAIDKFGTTIEATGQTLTIHSVSLSGPLKEQPDLAAMSAPLNRASAR
jgi:hypothetical protein